MLPQGTGMGVGLVAAGYATVVRLVGGMHVRMLFPVRRIREPSITAFVFTFEGFFP